MPGAVRRPRRRLLRILLNVATVLSLLLCVGAVAAWVRSYRIHDFVWWSRANPRLQLALSTYRGGLFARCYTPVSGGVDKVDRMYQPGAGWQGSSPLTYAQAGGPQSTFFNRFGFALHHRQNIAIATRQIACPYWFIVLLTPILPSARFAGWRRRRVRRLRMRLGLCQHCGYDCRATFERCPECGRVPAAGAEEKS